MDKERKPNAFARFAFVLFFVFCLISVITLRVQLNDLQDQLAEYQNVASECEYRLEELNYEYSLDEKAYIERYARLNGYLMPGEILFQSED